YVVPQDAPVELWDSAVRITVKLGDSLAAIAGQFGTPAWLIAQVNRLQDEALPTPGGTILIPQHAYRTGLQAEVR
ncbi:MAG: LysM peptidoglycan-binding domain-containing protein, partial [Pseudorhodoplanes sp.]|nr:LysM peptidoglycan-binding domain-containing protein [Pseudorhodoplanes sp.]